MKKVEIVLNNVCLESDELNEIINYLKDNDIDLITYNQDFYKDRFKGNSLMRRYSFRMLPFILMNNNSEIKALYTENKGVKFDSVVDFISKKEDKSKYINLYTSNKILHSKYYPHLNKYIKINTDENNKK